MIEIKEIFEEIVSLDTSKLRFGSVQSFPPPYLHKEPVWKTIIFWFQTLPKKGSEVSRTSSLGAGNSTSKLRRLDHTNYNICSTSISIHRTLITYLIKTIVWLSIVLRFLLVLILNMDTKKMVIFFVPSSASFSK